MVCFFNHKSLVYASGPGMLGILIHRISMGSHELRSNYFLDRADLFEAVHLVKLRTGGGRCRTTPAKADQIQLRAPRVISSMKESRTLLQVVGLLLHERALGHCSCLKRCTAHLSLRCSTVNVENCWVVPMLHRARRYRQRTVTPTTSRRYQPPVVYTASSSVTSNRQDLNALFNPVKINYRNC